MASRARDHDRYQRLRRALGDERLPAALIDLDAFESNVDRLVAPVRAAGKMLRVATKSVRSVDLVRRIVERAGTIAPGMMTYTAAETRFLAGHGFADLLLAYPTVQSRDLDDLVEANRLGAAAAVVVDAVEHLDALAHAAKNTGVTIPVVIDVDVGYRPFGTVAHIGVRRSPLRTVDEVMALASQVRAREGLVLHGMMAYEAHIAGMADASPFTASTNAIRRGLKRLARAPLARTRRELAEAFVAAGHALRVFNGGGTGSVEWTASESPITEVTVGSGFLDSHLFDYYGGLALEPAAFFALQVVRRPGPEWVTCHGGGYIASGAAGADRLPVPWLPNGLELLALEGAGEVQTPLKVPDGMTVEVGAPVFFRHAKAGELAEHFGEYLLVRGERVEGRAKTYRGVGECFLG